LEIVMPEIMVFAAAGRTVEQKRGLARDLTDAMVKNFQVPAESVTVQIVESPKDSKAKGGVLFSDR
jgi:4-oxalocrotonate tautomerase